MEKQTTIETYNYAIPNRLKPVFNGLADSIKKEIQEIRIRNNLPLAITVNSKPLFVDKNGQTSVFSRNAIVCNQNDISEAFELLTKHSVYAHTEEISEGYIKMDFGNRAGICGTFSESGMICDISSVNIRIARQIIGCAKTIEQKCIGGTLVLGPPGSGKTTIIRDLIRIKSDLGFRVAIVDSRGEITASCYGSSPYNLGANTDIYLIKNKAKGMEMALRTMFPNIIAFDEIGNLEELSLVCESFNAGVDVITTAHVGTFEEIFKRDLIVKLIKSNAVKTIVLLPKKIGEEIKIYGSEEIKNDFI